MKGREILDSFKKEFGKALLESRIEQNGKIRYDVVWLKVDRGNLIKAVRHLFKFGFPHFVVISANDFESKLEMVYEFSLGWGQSEGEILVNIKVDVPKDDLVIDTISSVVPGALVSEREKQEFLGLKIRGIPDNRNFFLPEDFKGHPWVKSDKEGVE